MTKYTKRVLDEWVEVRDDRKRELDELKRQEKDIVKRLYEVEKLIQRLCQHDEQLTKHRHEREDTYGRLQEPTIVITCAICRTELVRWYGGERLRPTPYMTEAQLAELLSRCRDPEPKENK